MVKVGLVTLAVTPSARQAPRTRVVFPAPSSPLTSTTSPARRPAASRAPAASVCSGELLEEVQLFGVTGLRLLLGVLGQERRQLGEVVTQQLLDRVRAQSRCGMKDREQQDHAPRDLALLRAAVDLGDSGRVARQQLGREVAERADDLRLDQLDLLVQVRLAGLDLLGQWVAVARRAATDHVRDEHIRALDTDLLEQLAEQLARTADKREPLSVLTRARRLADEHEVGVGVAGAEDQLRADVFQRTSVPIAHLPVDGNELLPTFIRKLGSHGRRVTFALSPLPAAGVDHRMTRLSISTQSRLAIVGRGRVGTALVRAFAAAGLEVEGPLTRGEQPSADVVLLCVPDAEIDAAAAAVAARFVGHVSGATPRDAVDFSLPPLQTVTGPETNFAGFGCAIAGSTPEALELARSLALAARMEPFEIDDSARAAYHASASIASNFVVTLEWVAERVASSAGINPEEARRMLAPLVRQTVDNWATLGPAAALTGPIARGDEQTVERQRLAIEEVAPDLLPVFDALANATRSLAHLAPDGSAVAA